MDGVRGQFQISNQDDASKEQPSQEDETEGKGSCLADPSDPCWDGPCSKKDADGDRQGDSHIFNDWGTDSGKSSKTGREEGGC
jgi:hypothetical protein